MKSLPSFSSPNRFSRIFSVLGLLLATLPVAAADSNAAPAVPPPGATSNPAVTPAPAGWYQQFLLNVAKAKGHQFDLLFDGDSITDFWQRADRGKGVWDQHYKNLTAIDFGIAGDQTQNVLWRLQQGQVDGLSPKLIVLMIGTNNLKRNSEDQIIEGIKAIVTQYQHRCPQSHILLLGIFPRGTAATDPARAKIIAINKAIAPLGDGQRITYLDIGQKFLQPDGSLSKEIMSDFLHPTTQGYEIWADAIQPIVDKYCAAPAK